MSEQRTNAFQDALGINPGPWTKERIANDVKNAGANVLWGAKDWGDAGRNLGGAFSGKDTEGKSLSIMGRFTKGLAGVGDATLGALTAASTVALAVPVLGEVAKGATVGLQAAKAGVTGAKAVKLGTQATKASAKVLKEAEKVVSKEAAATGTKAGTTGVSTFKPGSAGGSAPGKGGYPGIKPGTSKSGGYPSTGGSTSGRAGGKSYPETGGTGGRSYGGGTGGGRGRNTGPGGKPMPTGGGTSGGRTAVIEDAPLTSTRPDFNPLKDTKPYDPFNNPKSNPWPNMPKVKPDAPKPAPAPRKPTAPPVTAPPKPTTGAPKTESPWAPKSSVPDAVKPPTRTVTETAPTPQTQLKPITGGAPRTSRLTAFGAGAAAATVAAPFFMPKSAKGEPDKWVPSAIV